MGTTATGSAFIQTDLNVLQRVCDNVIVINTADRQAGIAAGINYADDEHPILLAIKLGHGDSDMPFAWLDLETVLFLRDGLSALIEMAGV